jgi:DNA-binding CsgD family transcriptional regulator
VYAELGWETEARREFERLAADGFLALPRDANWLVALTSLAQVCAFLADEKRAAALYELLLPYRGHMVVAGAAVACHGAVAHYLGLLAATLTRWDAARAHFDDALARHMGMGARPWIVATRYEYASMLLARGEPGDRMRARELATRAVAAARELGMAQLVTRARALQSSTPTPAPAASPARRYADSLTAREREVAGLLARGLTNRAIAAVLIVSERTVDAHVAHILGKLGFRTRAQVAAWAAERGLHAGADA